MLKDISEAVRWYRKAAEQRHSEAQNALAGLVVAFKLNSGTWDRFNKRYKAKMSALECYLHEEHNFDFAVIKRFFMAFKDCVVEDVRKDGVFSLVIPHWGFLRLKCGKGGSLTSLLRMSNSRRYVNLVAEPYDYAWCRTAAVCQSPDVRKKRSKPKYSLKRRFVIKLCQNSGTDLEMGAFMFDCFLSHLATVLAKGRPFRWNRFGRFHSVYRMARRARNPATGEYMQIPDRRVNRFSPARALREQVGIA
jgi:nucleoid DNA-binding protein